MNEKPSKWKVFTAGIIRENPVLRLVLGCCSALAVTTTVSGALGMGLAMTFVLVCSNIVISALRKVIPAKVHLPCYIVIIATFVTIVQMVLQAYVPALYKSLGVFLALIVVNCIILGRAEMFACKNSVVDSALDGLGMGCGYILTMLLMSSVREILGNGTWMGITIIPESIDRMSLMNQAPGGFFVFGCLMALCVYIEKKLNKPIERKTCGDVMLEKIDAATAWTISGSLSAADVTARTNGEYLSVAFETAGSLTRPTGRVRLALPAGLLEGKTLVRIAPDGTQTEMPFETKRGKIILTLDFVNSELPVMLFRLVPQTAAL
mgnify:CR=1 FL=1